MDVGGRPFYTENEEFALVTLMCSILLHANISIIGQNFSYDTQHFVRSWGSASYRFRHYARPAHLLPRHSKDLAFLASMYCEHYVYWKDELTDYRKMPTDPDKFGFTTARIAVTLLKLLRFSRPP